MVVQILNKLDCVRSTASVRNNDAACNIRAPSALTALCLVAAADCHTSYFPRCNAAENRWLTAAQPQGIIQAGRRKVKGKEYDKK